MTDRSAVEALPTRQCIASAIGMALWPMVPQATEGRSVATLKAADAVLALFRGAAVPAPPDYSGPWTCTACGRDGFDGQYACPHCHVRRDAAASSRPARPEEPTLDVEGLAQELASMHGEEGWGIYADLIRTFYRPVPLRPARPTEPPHEDYLVHL